MKRTLPLLLVLSLVATAFGCQDESHDDKKKAGDHPNSETVPTGQQRPNTNAPPTVEEQNTNPIEGIEPPAALVDVGVEFTDGPAWHPGLGVLFFTTPLEEGALYRVSPDGRQSKIRDGVRAQNTQPIGNTVTAAGDLITVEAKRIVRLIAGAGDPAVIAVNYANSAQSADDAGAPTGDGQFDTLNDVVARKDGTLYVTDPGYFANPEAAANRIYRVNPAGEVEVVETFDDVPRPNGVTLSPDESALYVGFSAPAAGTLPFIRKYTVNEDGTLGDWTKFIDIGPENSAPDGMTVDKAGNVYVATTAGVEVYKPDGKPWGTVQVPEIPTGLAFGGEDLGTLFITTQGVKIWQIKPKLAGLAP